MCKVLEYPRDKDDRGRKRFNQDYASGSKRAQRSSERSMRTVEKVRVDRVPASVSSMEAIHEVRCSNLDEEKDNFEMVFQRRTSRRNAAFKRKERIAAAIRRFVEHRRNGAAGGIPRKKTARATMWRVEESFTPFMAERVEEGVGRIGDAGSLLLSIERKRRSHIVFMRGY
ncbi:hypothetical protein FNV43_RR18204 [Rhamnella rubrinervis]|uniref:Uncharacterized protein n=1 Tax=Rhamnella rubrinervis TaxID=2594499 RepID=A0A8K0E0C6_9ROSA|nr:hypothetical protein FNV43_RR18204 [Rhamnella rubrinervis]